MRRFLLCVTVAATLAVGLAAGTATSAGTLKGGIVIADVHVQVVLRPEMSHPSPQRLGIAHIHVVGVDLDPTPPVTSFEQQADVGFVSCEPAGSAQCSFLPPALTLINFVQFDSSPGADPKVATVSYSWRGPTNNLNVGIMTLHDGGVPGNGLTGALDSATGEPMTNDYLEWGSPTGRPTYSGFVLAGQVTVLRY